MSDHFIVRLNKEVTAAREALATLKPQAAPMMGAQQASSQAGQEQAGAGDSQEVTGITEEIVEKLQEKATVLTQERKKRGKTVPEGLATADSIKQFSVKSSHPGLHSASVPGILALDVSVADTDKIVTGGADKTATVFNKSTEQVVAVLKGHSKKVNKVVYHMSEDLVITGSHDTTVRVWNAASGACNQVLRVHDGPVTGLSLHATGDYVLTTSTDQHWTFSDIATGKLITRVTDTTAPVSLTCAQVKGNDCSCEAEPNEHESFFSFILMVSSSEPELETQRSKFGISRNRAMWQTSPDTLDRSPLWHSQRTVSWLSCQFHG